MVKRCYDGAVRQDHGGLLGGTALRHGQLIRALLVEAHRVDAVHDDLAGQLGGQRLQQLLMAVVRHRDDDDLACRGGSGVVRPRDGQPGVGHRLGGLVCSGGVTRSEYAWDAGGGKPAGQAAPLRAGSTEDGNRAERCRIRVGRGGKRSALNVASRGHPCIVTGTDLRVRLCDC